MEYYDIVRSSCSFDSGLCSKLGFKAIVKAPGEVSIVDASEGKSDKILGSIAYGGGKPLVSAAKIGAKAIWITDYLIDKKLLEVMADGSVAAVFAMSDIVLSKGLQRSKTMSRMASLLNYSIKMDVEPCFITLADSQKNMCSYMQLVELAKLLGADDDCARSGISETTKRILHD